MCYCCVQRRKVFFNSIIIVKNAWPLEHNRRAFAVQLTKHIPVFCMVMFKRCAPAYNA